MLHLIAMAAAVVSSASTLPAQTARPLTQVEWIATPTGQDIANVYPPTAVAAGKSGAVLLDCKVATQGSLEQCQVEIEDPVGLEFGLAALELAPLFKMAQTAPDGSAVAGRTIRIPIMFNLVTVMARFAGATMISAAAGERLRGRSPFCITVFIGHADALGARAQGSVSLR